MSFLMRSISMTSSPACTVIFGVLILISEVLAATGVGAVAVAAGAAATAGVGAVCAVPAFLLLK